MIPPVPMLKMRTPESAHPAILEAIESATWLKVRRAMSALGASPEAQQGPEVSINLLSSFSLEPIEPALQLGLRCIPCRPRFLIAPLDTIEQQILDPKSPVYSERSLATVILWRAEELLPDLFFPLSVKAKDNPGARFGEVSGRIRNLAKTFLEKSSSPLFVSTLPLPSISGSGILDSQEAGGLAATISGINAEIHQLGEMDSRIHVLDFHRWSANEGTAACDLQMEFMARQPFTTKAAISLGFFLARNVRPLLVPRRKVLALDLDNTLWGGILGEDGVKNLKLGHDFPGRVFLRIQREILELKKQGVLLMLASKNEERDAHAAFAALPEMVLKREDFVSHKINFEPKYLNLRAAAAELGLGLDGFAFLDDSDFEREQMRQFNPEVAILNDRGDALEMLQSLLATDLFDAHRISDEDRRRHQDYELRSVRTAKPEANIEDFLRSLELKAKVEAVGRTNIERVVQLLGKTNQFNVTTRRHSLEEATRMASLPGAVCLTLRLIDKFGDQGIVGVMLAVPDSSQSETIRVDSFLISCRALGRGVEEALWSELTCRASANGFKNIRAEYLPTVKNGIVADVFERLGMQPVAKDETGSHYLLSQFKPITRPDWINVERV